MIQTYEAIVDANGTVRLLEAVHLPMAGRALVTILEEGRSTLHDRCSATGTAIYTLELLELLKSRFATVDVAIKTIMAEIERLKLNQAAEQERLERAQERERAIFKKLQRAADAYNELLQTIFDL